MGLAAYVHVPDDNGVTHAFGPGDDVPDWARARITNSDVWEDDDTHTAHDPDADTVDGSQEPPRAGRGSGRDEWTAFARAHDVDVDEDDSRDDIIELLVERGVVED